MATALQEFDALIEAEFGPAAVNREFKNRVRRFIRLGTGHEEVRARYGARLARLRHCGIGRAIRRIEEDFRAERRTFQILHVLGLSHDRLSLEVLRELRLLLRFARRSEYRAHYRAIAMLVAS
jgi:hypothetical protein